jgi:hypothetical protein
VVDDADATPTWPRLAAGSPLTLVKLAPDGSETTRYPGTVIAAGAPPPWLAVRAHWIRRPVELDGLRFEPGDTLHEFFSPRHWFNVFSVFAPDGELRGWYANVTYPARLDPTTEPSTLSWHDLYLDVVGLPDGQLVVRDEDELAAAGVAARDPALATAIAAARDELVGRLRRRAFPFHEQGGARDGE